MKMLFLTAGLLLCLSLSAQDSLGKRPFFKLTAVSAQGGVPGENSQVVDKATIAKVWPEFNSTSFFSYALWSGWGVSENNVMLSSHLIFDNYSRNKKTYSSRSQTLTGISFSREQRMFYSASDLSYTRVDTLTSSSGNPPLYRDDVIVKNAAVAYVIASIGVDVQQLFSTKQDHILSFYAGLGSSAQFSVRNEIIVQTRDVRGFFITSDPNYDYQLNTANGHVQSHLQDGTDGATSSRTMIAARAVLYKFYVPVGINIRLSTRPESNLSNLLLFLQVRLGCDYLKISGMDGTFNGYSAISGGVNCKF